MSATSPITWVDGQLVNYTLLNVELRDALNNFRDATGMLLAAKIPTLVGQVIPVANQAARNALTPYSGLQVYRLDLHQLETYNGTSWGLPVRAVSAQHTTAVGFYSAPGSGGVGTGLLSAPSIVGDGVKSFKITANFGALTTNNPGDIYNMTIEDTTLGIVLSTRTIPTYTYALVPGHCMTTVDVPAAGSHVYRLAGARTTGGGIGTLTANASAPIEIIVEQIT